MTKGTGRSRARRLRLWLAGAAAGYVLAIGVAHPALALDIQYELLPSPAAFTADEVEALEQAARLWESEFIDPIAVRVQVEWRAPLANTSHLAEVDLGHTRHPVPVVRAALILAAESLPLASALSELPEVDVPLEDLDGLRSDASVELTRANARALGLGEGSTRGRGLPLAPDALISLNLDQRMLFDADRSNGIVGFDLVGLVAHELGHALGFWSIAERLGTGGGAGLPPHALDLFRFAETGDTHDLSSDVRRLFADDSTYDNTFDPRVPLSSGSACSTGPECQDARHALDGQNLLMGPTFAQNAQHNFKTTDVLLLDRLGWDTRDDECFGSIEGAFAESLVRLPIETWLDFFPTADLNTPPTGAPFDTFDPLPPASLLPAPLPGQVAFRMALDFGVPSFDRRSALGLATFLPAEVDPAPTVLPAGDSSFGFEYLSLPRTAWSNLPGRIADFEAVSEAGGVITRIEGTVSEDGAPARPLGSAGAVGFRLTAWLKGDADIDDPVDDIDGVLVVDWVPDSGAFAFASEGELLEALLTSAAGGETRTELIDAAGLGLPPACANLTDDDGDGLQDYPSDRGCSSSTDDTEDDDDVEDSIWSPSLHSSDGVALAWMGSSVVATGSGDVQRDCFALSNGDSSPHTATATVGFQRGECPANPLFWTASNPQPGPNGDVKSNCAIVVGRGEIESLPLAPGQRSDACCFDWLEAPPDGMPARGDLVLVDFTTDGGGSSDEAPLSLDDNGPLGGSACGLLGVEALAVLLVVRSRRRAGASARRRANAAFAGALFGALAILLGPGPARGVCVELVVQAAPATDVTGTLLLAGASQTLTFGLIGDLAVDVTVAGGPTTPRIDSIVVVEFCPGQADAEIQVTTPAAWSVATASSAVDAEILGNLVVVPVPRSLPFIGGAGVGATREINSNFFLVDFEGGDFVAAGSVETGGGSEVIAVAKDYDVLPDFGTRSSNQPHCNGRIADATSPGFCPRALLKAAVGVGGGTLVTLKIPVAASRWIDSSVAPTPYLQVDGEVLLSAEIPGCDDGIDNDGDGLADLADPGCSGPGDASERDPALPCDDGIDNDLDGGIDFGGDADGDEISDPPGDLGCRRPDGVREDPACQDGVDNDGQVGTDFDGGESILGVGNGDPNGWDIQCTRPWRDRETPSSSCGLGAELAFIFACGLLIGRRRSWGLGS